MGSLVAALGERGAWSDVRTRLPGGWSIPEVDDAEHPTWVPLDDYVALLDAVERVLGLEALQTLGFQNPPDAGDSLVAGRIRGLGAAMVHQPADWLTLPGWLWRGMTRDAGTMRKIELGDTHVVFLLEGLPERLRGHAAFHARLAGLLGWLAGRGGLDVDVEVEDHAEHRTPALMFRVRWSACG